MEELKTNEKEYRTFDLTNEEDRTELEKDIESQSKYFRPITNITYKVTIESPEVNEVLKVFDDREVIKYELKIKAESAQGDKFEGVWEVGKGILGPIFKGYEKGAIFKITKTGAGLDTRYSVIKDF